MADPVTLAEAKAHLRITSSSEDGVIQGCLDAAHQWVESFTGLTLEPREVVELVDHASKGRLRAWPVQSVISVSYGDATGQTQTLDSASYNLSSVRRPARMLFNNLLSPYGRAIEVTLQAGYASPAEVPATLRQAILIASAHFYRDREGLEPLPDAVSNLCRPHRLMRI